MERKYAVTVRGTMPADLMERVSRFHAEAIRNRKVEVDGTAAKAEVGGGIAAAHNKDNKARSSVLCGVAESRASPEETAAKGGCS